MGDRDLPALRRYDWRDLLPSERGAMLEWVRSLGYDPLLIATRFAVTRDYSGRWAVHLTRRVPASNGNLRVDVAADQVVSRPVIIEADPATWPAFLAPLHRVQAVDVDGLVANVARSLAAADNDDERAEAVEMLLSGWYAAWPDEALTNPDAPLAAELVRLLGHRAPVGIQGPTDQEVPTGPYSGPCETCGKPLYTHVCPSCSPDRRTPGRGCINCRNTGMDQTPCLPPSG